MNPSFNDIYFLVRGVAVLMLMASLLGFLAGFLACYLSGGRAPGLPRRLAGTPSVAVPGTQEPVPQTFHPKPRFDYGQAPPPPEPEPPGQFEMLAAMGDAWEEERKRKAHDEELPQWAQP